MVRHAAVALACLALAHAIAAPAAFCPKVLEPLDRDSDECPDEVTHRNKPKACKAAADAAGSGARPPGSLVDAHIGRQHKHNNGEKYRYHLHTWARRYRLFKKSLRKRNLWPKMSSQEVAAYVAVAVAAAGAIVRVLRGRRGKTYPEDGKYP